MLTEQLPGNVALVVASAPMQLQRLCHAEEALIAPAVEKRQKEFRGGRNAARCALKQLGYRGDSPLLPVPGERRPAWPEGFTGSITHTKGFCAAAVTRSLDCAGIGIDVEPLLPLQANLLGRICTQAEQQWILSRANEPLTPYWGKIIFCIKETLYKVFNPIHRVFLGFHEAEVSLSSSDGRFVAQIWQRETGIRCEYRGRFSLDANFIYASTLLEI